MKKLRLRLWVRVLLVIIAIAGLVLILLCVPKNNFDELAKQCDEDKGYTCSIYEIEQYRR